MADDTTDQSISMRDRVRAMAKLADVSAHPAADITLMQRTMGQMFKGLEDAFMPKGMIGNALKAHLRGGGPKDDGNLPAKNGIGYSKINSDDVIKVMNSNTRQIVKNLATINTSFTKAFDKMSRDHRETDVIFNTMGKNMEDAALRLQEIRDLLDQNSYEKEKAKAKAKPGNGQYIGKNGIIMDDDFHDGSKKPSESSNALEDVLLGMGLKPAWTAVKSLGTKILPALAAGADYIPPVAAGAAVGVGLNYADPKGNMWGLTTPIDNFMQRHTGWNTSGTWNDDLDKPTQSAINTTNKYLPSHGKGRPQLNPNYREAGLPSMLSNSGPHNWTAATSTTDTTEDKLKDEGYRVKTETTKTGDMTFDAKTITYKADNIIFAGTVKFPGGMGSGSGSNAAPSGDGPSGLSKSPSGPHGGAGADDAGTATGRTASGFSRSASGPHGGAGKGDAGTAAGRDTPSGVAGESGTYRPSIKATNGDLSDTVFRTIASEARRKNPLSAQAVINNMINRRGAKGFGKTLEAVATQHGQYEGWFAHGGANYTEKEKKLWGQYITDALDGKVPDVTHGADSYRASSYLTGDGRGKTFDRLAKKQGWNNLDGNVYATTPDFKPGPSAPYSPEQLAKAAADHAAALAAGIDPATGQPTGPGLKGPFDTKTTPYRQVVGHSGPRDRHWTPTNSGPHDQHYKRSSSGPHDRHWDPEHPHLDTPFQQDNTPSFWKWLSNGLTKKHPSLKYNGNSGPHDRHFQPAEAMVQNHVNTGRDLNRRTQEARLTSSRSATTSSPVVQNIHNHSKNESSTFGHDKKKTVPAFDEMFMKLLAQSPMVA